MRPLPPSLSAAIRRPDGNAGLWYDKYLGTWREGWSLSAVGDGENPKLEWIKGIAGQPVGSRQLLAEAKARVLRLTLATGGAFGVFVTDARLVTGIGRSHPVENGFAWHPTLGVPYLPGSSVKGMVRAWSMTHARAGKSWEELFGSTKATGHVVFLDALPIEPVRLEADVITPHYANWTDGDPPGDWRDPKPIPFLTTAPGNAFVFAVVPANGADQAEVEQVFNWLAEALLEDGAGAKTAVGYGRFKLDRVKTETLRKELEQARKREEDAARRAEAERTPEGRWGLQIEGKKEGDILELVRLKLEKERMPEPAERLALARAIDSTGLLEYWRKGKKKDPTTQVGGDKIKALARLVDAELASVDAKT